MLGVPGHILHNGARCSVYFILQLYLKIYAIYNSLMAKKTQKTPQKELKQALRVMGLVKRGEYNE